MLRWESHLHHENTEFDKVQSIIDEHEEKSSEADESFMEQFATLADIINTPLSLGYFMAFLVEIKAENWLELLMEISKCRESSRFKVQNASVTSLIEKIRTEETIRKRKSQSALYEVSFYQVKI